MGVGAVGEETTKKTPLASSPTPIRLPPPSPISYSFPAAYLSTRHKHICKSIREHGGEGWMAARMLLRIQAVRDMC